MASYFDEINAMVQNAIASEIGEAVSFIGVKSGAYSQALDPDRPAQEAWAVVSISPRVGDVSRGIRGSSSTGSQHMQSADELWLTRTAFEGLAWTPEQGDVVVVHPGGEREVRYRVSSVVPLDSGDVQIMINEGGFEA